MTGGKKGLAEPPVWASDTPSVRDHVRMHAEETESQRAWPRATSHLRKFYLAPKGGRTLPGREGQVFPLALLSPLSSESAAPTVPGRQLRDAVL